MTTFHGKWMPVAFGVLSLAAFTLIGCDKRGTPGGPGATSSDSKPPLYGQADDTFNLTAASVSIKPGDAEKSAIGIKRGTNFDQDVAVAFSDVPKGITIDPSAPVIKSGESDAKFTMTAGDDAGAGRLHGQGFRPPRSWRRRHQPVQAHDRQKGHFHAEHAVLDDEPEAGRSASRDDRHHPGQAVRSGCDAQD